MASILNQQTHDVWFQKLNRFQDKRFFDTTKIRIVGRSDYYNLTLSQKWLTRSLHWSLFIRLLIRLMKFVTTEKYLIQVLLYCNRFLSELSCLKHERSRGEGIYGLVVMVNLIQWFGQLTYTIRTFLPTLCICSLTVLILMVLQRL